MPILIAPVISAIVTYLFAWGMLRWASQLGLVDSPSERKPHTKEIPIGGMALILGSLAGFLPFAMPLSPGLLGWLLGALSAALLGLFDDRRELQAGSKLLGQSLATLFPLLLGGLIITSVRLFGSEFDLGSFAGPFTFIWLLGITNAFNLMDGLDGLAIGATIILSATSAVLSSQTGNGSALALSLALLGGAVAFLRFNVYPARLFLGDGGSYFLGFTFAILTISAMQTEWGPSERVPLLVPIVLLGYPLADTLWAIIRRLRAGCSIFQADREHLHHQWLKKGWGYRRAVSILYGLLTLLAVLGLALRLLFLH